ncbi:aldehyde ferredoxin oxidoreductase [Natronomonas salina]|uniref:aldehyde ferredoxin oxidoreductase family protein n=1 Tax=Natronomonas salina TaxID=1710540 RepID=UPI0015B5CF18|nr:aldehyde ferredoxin oxidoreductase C-terminal domain-containing protein [Natronomonas salina]QLD88951.1 aldehyde ferredoxin oxidoreductase [Natronomonas salina]
MIHTEGPLLSIDVGAQETAEEAIDDVLETFVGGRGVGTKLAHDRIPFDADPLGPENSLVFATGPLQTSIMSYTGRMSCTGLSPLTDGLLSSNAGGFMSRPFIDTGYAAVEITGASDELVGVHVTDEGVEFEAVPELEEATVGETNDYIESEHGLDSEHTAVTGPAGENEVRFASIMTSGSRAFGRGGLGAVLGAKNVKFLTFEGDSRPEIEGIDQELVMEIHKEASESGSPMKDAGTVSVSDYANSVGALPTKYFEELRFDDIDKIGSGAVIEHKYKKGTCSSCAFACKLPTRDEESGLETEGPEYETMMSFGSNALVDDFVAIMKSNELCDQLGLDTISCGDVVSAYLASEDEFGNVDLIHETIEQIAYREGVGDTLAEGIDRFHDELGVENWTMKGMEFAAHDGRTLNGQGLSFATSNRGADHMYAEMYQLEYPLVAPDQALDSDGVAGKSDRLIEMENKNAVHDSGVLCKFAFSSMDHDRYAALFDTDWETLQEVGGRIIELERHFNSKRGFDRADDDALPYELEGLDDELSNYYDLRGWNDDGTVPDANVGDGGGAAPADD